MLKVEDMENQSTFHQYKDDWYDGSWDYQIKFIPNHGTVLSHHCEVDGATWSIKKLKDLDDLKRVYEAITDKEFN